MLARFLRIQTDQPAIKDRTIFLLLLFLFSKAFDSESESRKFLNWKLSRHSPFDFCFLSLSRFNWIRTAFHRRNQTQFRGDPLGITKLVTGRWMAHDVNHRRFNPAAGDMKRPGSPIRRNRFRNSIAYHSRWSCRVFAKALLPQVTLQASRKLNASYFDDQGLQFHSWEWNSLPNILNEP